VKWFSLESIIKERLSEGESAYIFLEADIIRSSKSSSGRFSQYPQKK